MGEQREMPKNEVEKPKGGAKKDDGRPRVDVKLDTHCACNGCVNKIMEAVRDVDGVEHFEVHMSANKLTVIGKGDATEIQDKLEKKTKKKFEIVSPLPKKVAGAGDKQLDKKAKATKPHGRTSEDEKPPKESTVVLEIKRDDFIDEILKILLMSKGAESANIDRAKYLVTAKGTMDGKQLVPDLKGKPKRNVEVVPPKTDDDNKKKDGGGKKKETKEGGGGGGDGGKKEKNKCVIININF